MSEDRVLDVQFRRSPKPAYPMMLLDPEPLEPPLNPKPWPMTDACGLPIKWSPEERSRRLALIRREQQHINRTRIAHSLQRLTDQLMTRLKSED